VLILKNKFVNKSSLFSNIVLISKLNILREPDSTFMPVSYETFLIYPQSVGINK